jgi:hypothetical protein
MAISDEVKERLAEIKGCPEPCGSGVVKIALSSGQTKNLPCPFLEPGCHYGKRMERELDRHIVGIMSDIGVPLRHLENFPKRQETEEAAEAVKWQARGFLIFTGDAGTGKSFCAALTLHEYLKKQAENHLDRSSWKIGGSSVMWCSAMDIADDREISARARRERLAVIDDLGGEGEAPAGQAALRGVLLKRYDMKLPTVITTTLTMLEIDIRYGGRIANRLTEDIGNGGRIIGCHSIFTRIPGAFHTPEGR